MNERRKAKKPWQSKTMWFNAIVAGVGALEAAAPGAIPAGPAMIAISVINAVLRTVSTTPVR